MARVFRLWLFAQLVLLGVCAAAAVESNATPDEVVSALAAEAMAANSAVMSVDASANSGASESPEPAVEEESREEELQAAD